MNRNLGSQFHPAVKDYPAERAGGVEGSVVGMVPTHVLWPAREYDRREDHAVNYGSGDTIDRLRQDLRSGEGFHEPLVVHYAHAINGPNDSGHAWVGEGNHRLRAAIEEGVPEVPVRVVRANAENADFQRRQGIGVRAQHRPEAEYSPGYLSSTIHPSMLEFGEKPKSDVEEIQDLLRPSWQ